MHLNYPNELIVFFVVNSGVVTMTSSKILRTNLRFGNNLLYYFRRDIDLGSSGDADDFWP